MLGQRGKGASPSDENRRKPKSTEKTCTIKPKGTTKESGTLTWGKKAQEGGEENRGRGGEKPLLASSS